MHMGEEREKEGGRETYKEGEKTEREKHIP